MLTQGLELLQGREGKLGHAEVFRTPPRCLGGVGWAVSLGVLFFFLLLHFWLSERETGPSTVPPPGKSYVCVKKL